MEKYSNKTNKFSIEQVVTLDIDSTGSVTQRLTNLETTLENTLLNALYPGIKVAVVNVPNEPLDAYEESQVRKRNGEPQVQKHSLQIGRGKWFVQGREVLLRGQGPQPADCGTLPALATGSHRLFRHPGLLLQGGDRGAGRIGAGS
jgi:hypothetical protein